MFSKIEVLQQPIQKKKNNLSASLDHFLYFFGRSVSNSIGVCGVISLFSVGAVIAGETSVIDIN